MGLFEEGMRKGEEDAEQLLKLVSGCLMAIVILAASTLFKGWIVQVLWGWFIAPLGLMELTLWHAIGISLIASVLTHKAFTPEGPVEVTWKKIGTVMVTWGLCLGVGFVIHQFM